MGTLIMRLAVKLDLSHTSDSTLLKAWFLIGNQAWDSGLDTQDRDSDPKTCQHPCPMKSKTFQGSTVGESHFQSLALQAWT